MIRAACAGDAEALQSLWRQIDDLHATLVPGYFRPGLPAGGELARPGRFVADPHTALLVAEAPAGDQMAAKIGTKISTKIGTVIGAVVVRVYDTPQDPSMVPRRRAHVEALVVDKAHRRAGVGTSLMDAATEWARARGTSEIVLTVWAGNAAGEAFYASRGYRIISCALSKTL